MSLISLVPASFFVLIAAQVIVGVTLGVGLATGEDAYLRMQDDKVGVLPQPQPSPSLQVSACYLGGSYAWAMLGPAIVVLAANLFITMTAVYVAHRAGGRRGTSSRRRVLATLRYGLVKNGF